MCKLRIVYTGIFHFGFYEQQQKCRYYQFCLTKNEKVCDFVLDMVLCAVSLILNIRLFSTKYKTPIVGKIGLLFTTLCFAAFTYFAFLMPENGLPPVLFS